MLLQYSAYCFLALLTAASAAAVIGADTKYHSVEKRAIMEAWTTGAYTECSSTTTCGYQVRIVRCQDPVSGIVYHGCASTAPVEPCCGEARPVCYQRCNCGGGQSPPAVEHTFMIDGVAMVALSASDSSLASYTINKNVSYEDGTADLVMVSFSPGLIRTTVIPQTATFSFAISNQFLTIGGQPVILVVNATSTDVPLGVQVTYSSGVLSYGLSSTPTIANYFFLSRLGVLYQFGSGDTVENAGGGTLLLDTNSNALYSVSVDYLSSIRSLVQPMRNPFPFDLTIRQGALDCAGVDMDTFFIGDSTTVLNNPQAPISVPEGPFPDGAMPTLFFLIGAVEILPSNATPRVIDTYDALFYDSRNQMLLVSTSAVVSDVVSGMIAYAAATPPITDNFQITAQSELTYLGAPVLVLMSTTTTTMLGGSDAITYQNDVVTITPSGTTFTTISRLAFYDPTIAEEVNIATFSSSDTLTGQGILYITVPQAIFVKDSTIQKLINTRLESLQQSVGIVDGRKVLEIDNTVIITITGVPDFSSTSFTGMVSVTYSSGMLTVAGGQPVSSISHFYFDNGDGLELFESGDSPLTSTTTGSSSLYVSGSTAFLTTIMAHSDFIAGEQATPAVSITSASYLLSETSPGVYDVIITDLATGTTYTAVRNLGEISFVDVSVPANVNIGYSNGMISIGSDMYAAGFHLAVLQPAPLGTFAAVIYLGDLPEGVTVSSGPTGGMLYLDSEGRALFTTVPEVITDINSNLIPSMFTNPVITIVSGATSISVLLSGSNVFDLNGADAFRIPANDLYFYASNRLAVSRGSTIIVSVEMIVSTIVENPANFYSIDHENFTPFTRPEQTYLFINSNGTAFITGNSSVVSRFYSEKYAVANRGSSSPSLTYLNTVVLPLADLTRLTLDTATTYNYNAGTMTLLVGSMPVGGTISQFTTDLTSSSDTTADPVDPDIITSGTASMSIDTNVIIYYSGEFAFATDIDSVMTLIDAEQPTTTQPDVIPGPITLSYTQIGQNIFLTFNTVPIVAVLGPGVSQNITTSIMYSMNMITYTDNSGGMGTVPAMMLYVLNGVNDDAMIFTGMATTPIAGQGVLWADGNAAFFSTDGSIRTIIARFPQPTDPTDPSTPVTTVSTSTTASTQPPAPGPITPSIMAPAPIVDLQFSIQGMLVLSVGGEAVLTISGEAGDFVEVQSGQTVAYTYNTATSLFTVTVGAESFTTSNFSALFAGENVLVSNTTSGGSITASSGGALYRDSNIVLFTDDAELIQEIAIRQDTSVILPTLVPTAADSSSWSSRLGTCSASCGTGFQVRYIECTDANSVPLTGCTEPLSPIRDLIPDLFVICSETDCPDELPREGVPVEGTVIAQDSAEGEVIITVSNVNLDTNSFTVEAIYAHPLHGSIFTQTNEQIDGSSTQHKTADLRTGPRPEDELIKINIVEETFEIQIIDIVNDEVAYVIRPYLPGEECLLSSPPGQPFYELSTSEGIVCIRAVECYPADTLVTYDQALGFFTFALDTPVQTFNSFLPSGDSFLRAPLLCVSVTSQTAFYVGFPSSFAPFSDFSEEIHSSYLYVKNMLEAPWIDVQSGSIKITRSSKDVHIGMSITAQVGVRDLELICYLDATGAPPAMTIWLKDGEVIQDSAQYDIRGDNRTLTFAEIAEEDAGNYTCYVMNVYRTDTASSSLTVVDEPTESVTTDPGATTSPTMAGPQWVLGGQWTECSQTCGVGVRVRVLECMDPFGVPSDACEVADIVYLPFELCGTIDCPGEVRSGIPEDGSLSFVASSRLGAVNVSVTISGSSVSSESYTLTYDATNVDGSTINIVFVQTSPGITTVTPTISLQMPQFAKIEFEFFADNTIAVFIDGLLTYYINVGNGATCYEVKESDSFTYSNLLLTIDQQVLDFALEPFEPINFVEGATFMGRTYFSESAPTPFPGPLTLCVDVAGQSAFYVNVPGAMNELNNILSGFRPPQLNVSRVGEAINTTDSIVSIVIGQNLSLPIGAMVTIRANLVDMGTPSPPTVTWTKNGQIIQSGGNLYIVFGGFELTISDFQPSDSGQYSITVSNIAGEDTVTSQLQAIIENGIIVRPAPIAPSRQRNFGVGQGTVTVSEQILQIGIYCPVMVNTADAVVIQTWIRNGAEVMSAAVEATDGNVTTYRYADTFLNGFPDGECIEYVCSVNISNVGVFSESVEVCGRAEDPPASVSISGQTTVLRDGSAMLNCIAVGGSPAPVLQWSINPGSNMIQAQYTILSNGSLFLMDIPANEDTTYCCEAYNEFGTSGETCITLNVQYAPAIDNPTDLLVDFTLSGQDNVIADVGQRIEVVAGTNLTIRCNADLGNPMGMREWSTVGGSPPSMELADGSLFLADVMAAEVHEVDFICRVENSIGFDQEASWVRVYVPPEIEIGAEVMFVESHGTIFNVVQPDRTVYVGPGISFCIQCIDNVGSPEADIVYKLDKKNIDFRDPRIFLDGSGSLLCFRNFTVSYNGNYTCTATNRVGTDEAYVNIAVGVTPAFNDPVYPSSPVNGYVQRTERMNVVVDAGFDVEVTASASLSLEFSLRKPGVPPAEGVTWFYQGNLIDETDTAVEILDDGTLHIPHVAPLSTVMPGQELVYQVVVSNRFGSDFLQTNVSVSGVAPSITTTIHPQLYPVGTYTTSVGAPQQIVNIQLYDTLIILCDASGVFPPDITWFVGGFPVNETLALHVVQPDGSLKVTGQTETPCIEYTCEATNGLDSARESVDVCGEVITFSQAGTSACSATCGPSAHRTPVYTYRSFVDTDDVGVVIDPALVPPSLLGPEVIVLTCPTDPCPEPNYVYVTGAYTECPECGGPIQQVRPIHCELQFNESSAEIVDINFCYAFAEEAVPVSSQYCDILPCPVWSTGDFGGCSASCGNGVMVREVSCIIPATDNTSQTVDDSECDMEDMPTREQPCNLGQCPYTWRISRYGACSTTCQGGSQSRNVQCYNTLTSAVIDTQNCLDQNMVQPITVRDCGTSHCSNYVWRIESENICSRSCGGGMMNQAVICHDVLLGSDVDGRFCNAEWKPPTMVDCNVRPCEGEDLCTDSREICVMLGISGTCSILGTQALTDCCASCSGAR